MKKLKLNKKLLNLGGGIALGALTLACGSSGSNIESFAREVPTTYKFKSRFTTDDDSVVVSGQYFRFVLIKDMVTKVKSLSDEVDANRLTSTGDIVSALNFYYEFDVDTSGSTIHGVSTTPSPSQTVYNDISSSSKDLTGKIAGNDSKGQSKNWNDGSSFTGWTDTMSTGLEVNTPEKLVKAYFERVEDLALLRAAGNPNKDPDGNTLPAYVDAEGRDYSQLIDKFLLMSVAFSQGTDDYLDDGTSDYSGTISGKGLDSDNTEAVSGKSYSSLEHQWDEGFGYFGAARNYNDYTDDEIAGKSGRDAYKNGYNDADGDGAIDLKKEFNYGGSVNAAKRDRGSSSSAPTDFTKTAFDAFLAGRTIITEANGALSSEALAALKVQRDIAVLNWEKAYAATVVHYCNDTLQDMNKFGTSDYSFTNHAKHWSEMKGFALGLQFNPRSPLSAAQFADFHEKIGDKPVLANAGTSTIEAYKTAIREARNILKEAYSFDAANIGDDNGENGW